MTWKFSEPENVAVIVNRKILDGSDWIAYVTHDADDGCWQFHNREELREEDAAVASLKEIASVDSTVVELADLPLGCYAWRESPSAQWQRGKKGLHAV